MFLDAVFGHLMAPEDAGQAEGGAPAVKVGGGKAEAARLEAQVIVIPAGVAPDQVFADAGAGIVRLAMHGDVGQAVQMVPVCFQLAAISQ